LKCTIKVHIKTPKIELSTEKEVAQLILNKDEKCIRQEILKFLTDDEIVAEVKPPKNAMDHVIYSVSAACANAVLSAERNAHVKRKPEV
jgi:hypothetical protein